MRGALVVVVGALLVGLLVGLVRARQDMRDELAGATALARVSELLVRAPSLGDAQLLERLHERLASSEFRHLQMRLIDGAGRVRLQPDEGRPASALLRALIAVNDALLVPPPSRTVNVALPRPDGSTWQLQWIASHDSEQREALAQLAEDMAELAGCAALMLLVMRWHVRRSFRPLAPLLAAIECAERDDLAPMRDLPAMPIRELDVIASSLRHLADALTRAEAQRRQLSAQVLTSQEDERSRIARELHDELGQHLTALRFDIAWLERRTQDRPDVAAVVAGIGEHCARLQQDVRALLTRLRPLGGSDLEAHAGGLRGLLEQLVQGWSALPGNRTRYDLEFRLDRVAEQAPLPRDLMLTVYRISQEALTNVARHAKAARAALRVVLRGEDGAVAVQWSVEDDGCGMDPGGAWQRGNGLAGLKERIWAAGGDLALEPVRAGGAGSPGLRLRAELRCAGTAA